MKARTLEREVERLKRIQAEFVRGFKALHALGPAVTVFGSARFKEDHPYYRLAREVGAELARAGFATLTGGGPGIMEAANRGAHEAGGASIGLNIILPHEQRANPVIGETLPHLGREQVSQRARMAEAVGADCRAVGGEWGSCGHPGPAGSLLRQD
jgi:hypothetical protein